MYLRSALTTVLAFLATAAPAQAADCKSTVSGDWKPDPEANDADKQ